ncbi:hypothetical protein Y032_0904g2967 [Ancylostoma ceylanicum]|uniref:Uncharacterized protein n=1 Tax=Ancylostoma ceylanicum TaxID=53326 RepID=A0A016WAQ2_9BILA|nr:hypothetical protein Y032_0904g2967 [Ancylostoma ceylanicum]
MTSVATLKQLSSNSKDLSASISRHIFALFNLNWKQRDVFSPRTEIQCNFNVVGHKKKTGKDCSYTPFTWKFSEISEKERCDPGSSGEFLNPVNNLIFSEERLPLEDDSVIPSHTVPRGVRYSLKFELLGKEAATYSCSGSWYELLLS